MKIILAISNKVNEGREIWVGSFSVAQQLSDTIKYLVSLLSFCFATLSVLAILSQVTRWLLQLQASHLHTTVSNDKGREQGSFPHMNEREFPGSLIGNLNKSH